MNTPVRNTLGVLLAAGAGTRFVGPKHKLRSLVGKDFLFTKTLGILLSTGLESTLVVTGAVNLDDLTQDSPTVHNAQWATGQRSSVITAISYARLHGFSAIVVGLADQPGITSQAWQAVASSDSPIAVATYDGIRGNPVRLHESVWGLLESDDSDPDSGARTLMRLHPELVLEVACKGNSADIDTTEDLSQWT
jgi:CTP:molybdopterin cytidylyltransferase MocA